ncbi:MAG: head GIN domain-containing protein [Casimicrobiaceae bacterium]
MRRLTLPLVILACVAIAALLAWLALNSASFGDRRPRDDAPTTRAEAAVTHELPPFKRMEVAGAAEVTLVQGTAESIAITPPARRTSRIRAEVRGDTLYIEAGDSSRWWDWLLGGGSGARPGQIIVTFKDLEAIAAAGSVKLTAAEIKVPELKIAGAGGTALKIDNLQCGQLKLSGAGGLKAEVSGRVTDQTITIAGAGEYRGGKLVSQNATVSVAGAGQVIINAEKTLTATISGAGTVDYIGDPKVTERVSGVGRVRRRDSADAGYPRFAVAQ